MRAQTFSWLVVLALLPGVARADGYTCWLDHVTRSGDGVELHFDDQIRLTFRVNQVGSGERRQYFIDQGKGFIQNAETRAIGAATPVLMAMGDTGFAYMRIEDSCTFTFAQKDGVLGVILQNAYSDPDGSRHSNEEFAPAS